MLNSLLLLYFVSVQRASAQQQEGGLGPCPYLGPQVELETKVHNHGEGPNAHTFKTLLRHFAEWVIRARRIG